VNESLLVRVAEPLEDDDARPKIRPFRAATSLLFTSKGASAPFGFSGGCPMTKPKTKTNQAKREPGPAVVLFGQGDGDKPRAAYFSAAHAALAIKAADAMKLSVLKVESPELKALVGKLPAGRIHANGRGLVPFVRSDLYAKLAELAQPNKTEPATPAPSAGTANTSPEKPPDQAGSAAAVRALPTGTPRLPHDWDHIEVGDLVVAQEADPEDGWWEAIVAQKNGDMLSLRWRQTPRQKAIVRHRLNLARLCPAMGADTAAHSTAQASVAAQRHAEQSLPTVETADVADRYPATWDEIRADQVVVAKEDGPFQGWWEAIVTEANGDTLTLRWRNRPQLLPIVRHRLHVALMLPKAA
jgi:hypothetical protein